jgi:hypothetical protein
MPFVAKRVFDWDVVEVTAEWGLRDLPPGRAYAVCNTLHCEECATLLLDLRFDDEELGRLYADYRGEAYTSLRDALEPGYAERNRKLLAGADYVPQVERFLLDCMEPPRRVLDWGGDTGINTPFRGRVDAQHILDISDRPLVPGAERVDAAAASSQHYDLVVLSEVLEHVPQPLALLEQVAALLDDDSVLYVEVPFEALMRSLEAEPQRWREKRHWHEHINFFSRQGLHRLLARCGLSALRLDVLDIDVGNGPVKVFALAARRARAAN